MMPIAMPAPLRADFMNAPACSAGIAVRSNSLMADNSVVTGLNAVVVVWRQTVRAWMRMERCCQ